MAVKLEKTITREVVLCAVSRSLPGRRWLVTVGPAGISVKEKGDKEVRSIDWVRLIGFLRIHGHRQTNGVKP